MKKKILIADKDASLKEAFRIIFSEDMYEILYAASAKEVEKLASSAKPEIYIVNVNLLKSSGIEVYRQLQKDRLLDNARFFFLKDENDSTELLGFQAEGVIEKPINFFKVHERIAKDEDLIVLVEEVEETPHQAAQSMQAPPAEPQPMETRLSEPQLMEEQQAGPQRSEQPQMEPRQTEPQQVKGQKEWTAVQREESATKEAAVREDAGVTIGMEMAAAGLGDQSAVGIEGTASVLETELRKVLNESIEEVVPKLAHRIAPVLSTFVEEYTRRMLYEIAEKVIREEINKLLKESAS
jgi:DNA-binding NarL/FixJ family response regulator